MQTRCDPSQLPLPPRCLPLEHCVQARIHYYWFKKQREECRKTMSPCDMGGFTRLLHSGEADDLMDEIPTVVVDPLPKDKSGGSYVVLNRPFAFMTFLKRVSIPERYILMGEVSCWN